MYSSREYYPSDLEDWQEDRAAARDRVRQASEAYKAARRAYARYPAGTAGQRAAAAKVDGAASTLAEAEEELVRVDTYSAWCNR